MSNRNAKAAQKFLALREVKRDEVANKAHVKKDEVVFCSAPARRRQRKG